MDIIGRATIVLRIQRVKSPKTQQEGVRTRGQKRAFEESQPEELHEQSYVLKLMWRDPEQESEGPILERLVGIYGVVQHLWHCDVHRSCKRRHLAGSGCEMCLDETPEVEDMLVCENLTNIQHAGRMTGNRDVYEPIEVNTKRLVPTTQTRRRRIYSRILLSSVGKPLWAAESPRELLMGILDAIMGCWSLMNLGVLHRDISGGNVMLVCSDQHDRQRKWLDEVDESEEISDSEARLREYLAIFSRDPTGMLSDFDLHVQLSDGDLSTSLKSESASSNTSLLQDPEDTIRRSFAPEPQGSSSPHPKRRKTEDSYVSVPASAPSPIRPIRLPRRAAPSQTPTHEKIDYRVGTTPFMSVNVLNVQPGEPYEHSFMDDLESFFWVLFYVMVEHTDPGVDSPNHEAKEILDLLDSEDEDMREVRLVKVTHLENCHRRPEEIVKMLHKTQNCWACDKTLTQILIQLGSFFSDNQEVALSDLTPAKAFPIVVNIFVEALEKM
ncbi:hypothetical protein FRC12_005602 [Ceratobasidium sp. 428]|nr:hypothetical protein FRC12_005602 [Ceratobasidium sp. 428]